MNYTNKELIKRIKKAKKDQKNLTHITDKSSLSTEDIVKLGLCKHFVQFAVTKRLKLKDVAKMIDIPIPRVSEIINYKISKFTVDKLLENLDKLAKHDAQVREFLIFFRQAAEVPTLAVAKTRVLTRDLKEASIHV